DGGVLGEWVPSGRSKSRHSWGLLVGAAPSPCVHHVSLFFPDDHGNSNGSHVKIFLPKKLLECLPKCSSLPKERHRWNTNEVVKSLSLFLNLPVYLMPMECFLRECHVSYRI
uniref:Calmodulin binding transcription activator 1 n=1 Tax=Calidris pygmaea TaxID=425635 RepID=A0A8C3KA04_9CHAR